jgi:predicted ATP-dependent serine protease
MARLKEAAKLGFTVAIGPEGLRTDPPEPNIRVTPVSTLSALVASIVPQGTLSRRTAPRMARQDG